MLCVCWVGPIEKRKASSCVIMPPASPLSSVGRYKAGSGWYAGLVAGLHCASGDDWAA